MKVAPAKNRLINTRFTLLLSLVVLLVCLELGNAQDSARFKEVPLPAIKPSGWMRTWLENQRDGMTGHLEESGTPFDQAYWAGYPNPKTSWWPYEQNGYWVDGMIRCGILLDDHFLIDKAEQPINFTLAHPASDGLLGPDLLRDKSRWPQAIIFRALMAHYSLTGDKDTVEKIRNNYIGPKNVAYRSERDGVNIENILWAYGICSDPALLKLAEDIYKSEKSRELAKDFKSGKPSNQHGVTYNETAKIGAILFSYTGKTEYLNASVQAYKKIEQFHQTVDGLHVSTERLFEMNDENLLEGHETCDISDFIWSLGYLLLATGDASYADKIEKATYNALPGAVMTDFRGCQYFSAPNQAIAVRNSNQMKFARGKEMMTYAPQAWENVDCCAANVSRAMPGFVARMWMQDQHGGVVAAMYGPSSFAFKVGPQTVTIQENTRYPFSDSIEFVIQTDQAVEFPFTLRIPGWCSSASILVNGQKAGLDLKPGTYQTLKQKFKNGDKIEVVVPSEIRLVKSPKNGITVEKGPLVYALGIKYHKERDEKNKSQSERLPAYTLTPSSQWNYALEMRDGGLVKAENIKTDGTDYPWAEESAPIRIKVSARALAGWDLVKTDHCLRWGKQYNGDEEVTGDFIFTPSLPDPKTIPAIQSKTTQTIELVPYGCTKLRVSIFPVAG